MQSENIYRVRFKTMLKSIFSKIKIIFIIKLLFYIIYF